MSLRLVGLTERKTLGLLGGTHRLWNFIEGIGMAPARLSFVRFVITNIIPFRVVLEARVLAKESEGNRSGGAVALFLDDDFRLTLHILVVFVIKLFSVNEHDHICILFNGAGFTKVRHLRLSPGPIFDLAVELR